MPTGPLVAYSLCRGSAPFAPFPPPASTASVSCIANAGRVREARNPANGLVRFTVTVPSEFAVAPA